MSEISKKNLDFLIDSALQKEAAVKKLREQNIPEELARLKKEILAKDPEQYTLQDWAVVSFGAEYARMRDNALELQSYLAANSGQLVLLEEKININDSLTPRNPGEACSTPIIFNSYHKSRILVAELSEKALVVARHPYYLGFETQGIDLAENLEVIKLTDVKIAAGLRLLDLLEEAEKYPIVLRFDLVSEKFYCQINQSGFGEVTSELKDRKELEYLDVKMFRSLSLQNGVYVSENHDKIKISLFEPKRDVMVETKVIAGTQKVLEYISKVNNNKAILQAKTLQDIYQAMQGVAK